MPALLALRLFVRSLATPILQKMRVIFGFLSVPIIRGEARASRVAAKLGSFFIGFLCIARKGKAVNDSERVCAFAKKY